MTEEKMSKEKMKKNMTEDHMKRDNAKKEGMRREKRTEESRSTKRESGTELGKKQLQRKNENGSQAAAIILIVIIAVLVAAYFIFGPKTQSGSKSITITVTDNTGADTVYESRTDAEYLIEAVNEIDGLDIQGTESEYGLFINSINGITADYNVDQSYWAIYVNGEYGNYGIDAQPVADGDEYTFVYEISTY